MRIFLAVATLVAVADTKPDKKLAELLKSLHSFPGPNPCAAEGPPGVFGMFKSNNVAYRLQDGHYCREMVALSVNGVLLLTSNLAIDCGAACQEAWSGLPAVSTDLGIPVRCLVPQRALRASAPKDKLTKWRSVEGTNVYVRLELPRAGLPCVAHHCAGRSRCVAGLSSPIRMCTDDKPSALTVCEIFAAVVNAFVARDSGSNALQQGAMVAPTSAKYAPGVAVRGRPSVGDHCPSGQRVDQRESPPQDVVGAPAKPPRTARVAKLPGTTESVAPTKPEEQSEQSEFMRAVLEAGRAAGEAHKKVDFVDECRT